VYSYYRLESTLLLDFSEYSFRDQAVALLIRVHGVPKQFVLVLSIEYFFEIDHGHVVLLPDGSDDSVVRMVQAEKSFEAVGAGEIGKEDFLPLKIFAAHTWHYYGWERKEHGFDAVLPQKVYHRCEIFSVSLRQKRIVGMRVFYRRPDLRLKQPGPKVNVNELLQRLDDVALIEDGGEKWVLSRCRRMIGINLHQIVPTNINRNEIWPVSDDFIFDSIERKIGVVTFDAGVNDFVAAVRTGGIEQRLQDGGIGDIPNAGGEGARIADRNDSIDSRRRTAIEFRTDETFRIDAELISVSKSTADIGYQLGTAGSEIIPLVWSTKEKGPGPDAELGYAEKKRHDDEREDCLFSPGQ
jgi:hypothetical protein